MTLKLSPTGGAEFAGMGEGFSGQREEDVCDGFGKGEGLSHSRSAEGVGVAAAQGGGQG